MMRTKAGPSNPNQAVRLIWFLLFFLSPMAAIGYVSLYGLKNGNEAALLHVLTILAISMVVSVVCGVAQPLQTFDEANIINAGRLNLGFAVVDSIIFVLLAHDPSAVMQPCEPGAMCRTFPVGWLALAGMHYCWAVWAYTTALIGSR